MDCDTKAATTPRVAESYPARYRYKGSVAKSYLKGRAHQPKWQREQDVFAELVRRLPRRSAILDVPIGTGRFIEFYASCDHVVYGLDVSFDMVAQARAAAVQHQAAFTPVLGDAEAIPLRDRSVDYVVCVRFLNWVPLPTLAKMLSEFNRASRKGVVVHIRTRETLGPFALLRTLLRELRSQPIPLLRRFVGALRLRLVSGLRSLSPGQGSGSSEPTGYVFHDSASLEQVFRAGGFEVSEKIPIDPKTAYSRSQSESLHVYVLRRSKRDA